MRRSQRYWTTPKHMDLLTPCHTEEPITSGGITIILQVCLSRGLLSGVDLVLNLSVDRCCPCHLRRQCCRRSIDHKMVNSFRSVTSLFYDFVLLTIQEMQSHVFPFRSGSFPPHTVPRVTLRCFPLTGNHTVELKNFGI